MLLPLGDTLISGYHFFVMLIAVNNQCLDFPSFYKASCMTLFLIIKGKKWVSFVVINSIILVALCPMEMH